MIKIIILIFVFFINFTLHASDTESSSCNNACKRMTIKVRGNSAHFYCLHKQDAPSGWGWVEDGNSQQALPLCECHPMSRPEKRYYVYCA
ncbi:exported protein of unknown function [Legionella hackeliae]|uniref:Secreted protein n=1 Tax=Legionella hackeliae TaxID=449 RepID=A0A0A8US74_LEGHA|nr:exported protein of unknown function [Legionella hackeliae]